MIENTPSAAIGAGCHTLGVLTTYPHLDGDTVPDLSEVDVRPTPSGLVVRYTSGPFPPGRPRPVA